MRKQYIAPSVVVINYIDTPSPLCASKVFEFDTNDASGSGSTTSSVWSNKKDTPNQGGMWSNMDE